MGSNRTTATLTIHVPKHGWPDMVRAAVGAQALPAEILASQPAMKVLQLGGRIQLKDEGAPYGRVQNRSVEDWMAMFPGLDLDVEWLRGGTYDSGANFVRAGEEQGIISTLDGEEVVGHAYLARMLKEGKSLAYVVKATERPPATYPVPDLEVELEV